MKKNRESLEILLNLIDEIIADPEYDWFKEELSNRVATQSAFDDFPAAVRHLRKGYKVKANEFYKMLPQSKLRSDLVRDNIEMQWRLSIGDIPNALRYMFYQMENMLNNYNRKKDAHNLILADKNSYQLQFSKKVNVICDRSFFNKDNSKKELKDVNILGKMCFWLVHRKREQWFTKNELNSKTIFWTLVNNRNSLSHKDSEAIQSKGEEYTKSIMEDLEKKDLSSISFYINFLKVIRDSIVEPEKGFDIPIQPIDGPTNPNATGPKVVGKIKLPDKKGRMK